MCTQSREGQRQPIARSQGLEEVRIAGQIVLEVHCGALRGRFPDRLGCDSMASSLGWAHRSESGPRSLTSGGNC